MTECAKQKKAWQVYDLDVRANGMEKIRLQNELQKKNSDSNSGCSVVVTIPTLVGAAGPAAAAER